MTPELTADRYGNPGAFVFATPMLVALLEETAIQCVAPALEPGAATVGTRLDVEHKAATPVGLTVTAKARLIEVDRRRLVFEIEASDDREPIASGTRKVSAHESLCDSFSLAVRTSLTRDSPSPVPRTGNIGTVLAL